MTEAFTSEGINWEGAGYFGCPEPPTGYVMPADKMQDPWLYWMVTFNRAKAGDHALVPGLFDIIVESVPSPLAMVCSDLLSDAGTSACFQALINELDSTQDFDTVSQLSGALALRGMLSDITVLLRAYERHCRNKDADVIPVMISSLIESEDGPLSDASEFENLEDYKSTVMSRYNELADHFGSNQVLIYRSEIFSVRAFARHMVDRVCLPYPPVDLRHRFEASTGIDCTSFYKDGVIQPLAVAAIVEEFLESSEAGRYEEGARYFFGHRIP